MTTAKPLARRLSVGFETDLPLPTFALKLLKEFVPETLEQVQELTFPLMRQEDLPR